MTTSLETLKDELLEPVSGDNPCGENPRYDDRYEQAKSVFDKISGAGAGSADWDALSEPCESLMRVSKDLNLTAYTTIAWVYHHGFEGLIVGLELVEGMLYAYWEHLYPAKPRGRAAALKWMQEKLNERRQGCHSQDPELINRGLAACKMIKDFIYEKFENPPADFKNIRNFLKELKVQLPKPEEKTAIPRPETQSQRDPGEDRKTDSPSPPQARAEKPSLGKTEVEMPALDSKASLDQVFDHLGTVAGQIYTADPVNGVACLLRRLANWHGVSEPKNDNGVSSFPAPDSFKVDALKNMLKNGSWRDLFARAESLFAEKWYWLDLQYYAAQAAEGLGTEDLVSVVERQTMELENRMPNLKNLMFQDNSAFASPETKNWLAQLPAKLASGGAAGMVVDPVQQLLSDMRKQGKDGFTQALEQAQIAIDSAADRRMALQMRIQVATFCLEAEQPFWAESLARAMIEEIDTYQLHYWEPRLAAQAWKTVLEVARLLKESNDVYLEWESRAMVRLAGLDMGLAAHYPKAQPVY